MCLVRSVFFLILHFVLTWAADCNSALSPGFVTHLLAWEHPASCTRKDFQGESRALLSFVPEFSSGTQDSENAKGQVVLLCAPGVLLA